MTVLIELSGVNKSYSNGSAQVVALADLDLKVPGGEFVSVRGPSGCGKTTLLMILGGMLRPTQGTVHVADTNVYAQSPALRADFRSRHVGFVFQMFHLVPYLTVQQNVKLGQTNGTAATDTRVGAMLDRLGLSGRANHRPAELSTGEQQRTALARALIKQPKLILADEPAGNLDPDNAAEVFRTLQEYRDDGGTVMVVTHGDLADEYADRVLRLDSGRLVSEVVHST